MGNVVSKFLHTRMRVSNLDESVNFYQKVFGLEVSRRHESPRGSKLVFLSVPNSDEEIELTFFPGSGVVEVQDSVRLFNYAREQQLETEYLIWNKKDSTIRTDRNVLVRSPKEILKGKGLVTKQDFSFFEILEPTGKINLKKE